MSNQQGPREPLEELEILRQLRDIVDTMLYHDAVIGEWPDEQCRYCGGHSNGYHDSQGFAHSDDCVVEKIRALRMM